MLSDLVSDIGTFTWAILSHLAAYMTGGLIVMLWGAYERIRNKSVPLRVYVLGVTAFFAVAIFMSWRDEHRKRLAYERLSLVGRLEQLSIAPAGDRKQNSILTVFGLVSNPTGPPTVADNWQVALKFKDRSVTGKPMLLSSDKLTLARDKGPPLILSVNDYLPKATMAQPIATGGAKRGWIISVIEGVSLEQIERDNPLVSVSFQDVKGNPYFMEHAAVTGSLDMGIDPYSTQPWNQKK
jgi:hypothetical protein